MKVMKFHKDRLQDLEHDLLYVKDAAFVEKILTQVKSLPLPKALGGVESLILTPWYKPPERFLRNQRKTGC
jgi:hypothetical protein